MGLDTTHDCWHGSYSTFAAWRAAVAKAAGYPPLLAMEGFGGERSWASFKNDALTTLLNHSDCDGKISHKKCLPLAIRLEELIPIIAKQEDWWMADATKRFAAGLRDAHDAGEDVEFA